VGLEALLTLAVLLLVLGLLVFTRVAPDVVLVAGVTALLVAGVIGPQDAFAGLANEGVVTVAVLFVVASGIQQTGALDGLVARLLGRPRNQLAAQARLVLPTAVLSAFVNNTPVVAMLMPVVSDWSRKLGVSPSRLLMPLSFASILGGACTLVGTSTNLIVNGWLIDEAGLPSLGMFEIAWVALPVAVAGMIYMLVFGRLLLPERSAVLSVREDPREYTVELIVEPGSPFSGRSIEGAGLRNLPGLYLMEINRGDSVLPAVSGNVRLKDEDRLVFVGVVDSVVDLAKMRGLSLADEQLYKLDEPRPNRVLVEAVVSESCPVVGNTIREGRFRTRYHAVVLAVARNGERLEGKLGDVVLQPGDTLLLEARSNFLQEQRHSRDFYLVSQIEGGTPPNYARAPHALAALSLMVVVVAGGWLSMLQASMLTAGVMLATRCLRGDAARASVDWQVIIVIAAALGLGRSIQVSGLAEHLAQGLIGVVGGDPMLALATVFGTTMLLAALVTAKAGAVLILPVALVLSQDLGLAFEPFAITVMIAAATTVATPIGYPTNLMVMGPGAYRFRDYLVFGGPLSLLVWVLTMLIVPSVWSF